MAKKGRKTQDPQTELQPQLSLVDEEDEALEEENSPGKSASKIKANEKGGKEKTPPLQATLEEGLPEDEAAVESKPAVESDSPEASEPSVEDHPEDHPGNGVARDGEDVAATAQEGEEEVAEEIPEETGPQLVKLVNTHDGCWMELDDGSKVELNEDEWRTELAHNFGRTGAD